MPYLAIRYRVDRISSSLASTILATIPHRIAYFDGLALEMYPINGAAEIRELPISEVDMVNCNAISAIAEPDSPLVIQGAR